MNDAVETRSVHEFRSLPENWTVCTLFDLVASPGIMRDGDWVETKDQDPNGEVRLIQLADIGDGNYLDRSARFLTAKKASTLGCTFLALNDLLIARMADPVGRVCIFPGDAKPCVTAVDVCIFRAGHQSVDHRWLMHILNSPAIRNRMESLAKGVTRKRISGANLKRVQIPLPPMREQQRTADKIDELFSELDAGVASLKRAKALLKKYRQSVLKAAVTGELTRDWRARHGGQIEESGADLLQRILKERRSAWETAELKKLQAKGYPPKDDRWKQKYKEPQPPDTSDLPELPKEWAWATVDQFCAKVANGLSKKPRGGPPGAPILRISAVRPMSVDTDDIRYYPTDTGEDIDDYVVNRGDLLFTRYNGSFDLVGVCGVSKTGKAVLHPDKLIRAKLASQEMADAELLAAFLSAGSSRAFIEQHIKTTAGQHGISGSDVKRTPIPLPPVSEQQTITSLIAKVWASSDRGEQSIEIELLRAERTRQAILKAAFAGNLVPQDPNDEPASVLLERIRAERAARPKPARGRRGGWRKRNSDQFDRPLDRDDAA